MEVSVISGTAPRPRRKHDGLSYKFQRLRERLRQAIASGELSGKLPGERALARRFHVNAKTLSKALTDLAAEGLLDRSIGRGTYVKGSAPQPLPASRGRWLIICEPERAQSTLCQMLREANVESQVIHDVSGLRPSFLKQFDTVIDYGCTTSQSFLRDMVVRNMTVVAVNREPDIYSLNLVATDRALGAASLTRDLILGGHRRIVAVESMPRSIVGRTVQQTAARYASDASVQVCGAAQVVDAVRGGATAVISDSSLAGKQIRDSLEAAGLNVPGSVSLGAVGCDDASNATSGYFVDCALLARTVNQLVGEAGNGARPMTLWLVPQFVDRGTIRPLAVRTSTTEQAA